MGFRLSGRVTQICDRGPEGRTATVEFDRGGSADIEISNTGHIDAFHIGSRWTADWEPIPPLGPRVIRIGGDAA
jgi:hypothetical protein